MADQFDLYRMQGGNLVVVLQSGLFDQLWTRVVAPLFPANSVDRILRMLNPTVTLGGDSYIFMPQLMATLALAEMGEKVGSLAMLHETIMRAADALLSGF